MRVLYIINPSLVYVDYEGIMEVYHVLMYWTWPSFVLVCQPGVNRILGSYKVVLERHYTILRANI